MKFLLLLVLPTMAWAFQNPLSLTKQSQQHVVDTTATPAPIKTAASWFAGACLALATSPALAVSGGGLDFAGIDISGQDFSKTNYKGKDFTQGMCVGDNTESM